MVPIEPAATPNRQVVEWDKDDLDVLGFMKVDCLDLTCSAACAGSSIC
jgi:error-prone DNA polymerase